MAATYPLKIVSPDRIVYEANVESLVSPGSTGSLGVLARHAPLLTTLANGKIQVRDENQNTHEFSVNGGILEVSANGAVILADEIIGADGNK